ncbi:MAG: DUF1177 domain-containing protein [Candidatus Bipolaricaulia bacterium]
MLLKEIIQAFELIDNPQASGAKVTAAFDQNRGVKVELETLEGDRGSTDLIKLSVAGLDGKLNGGKAPTLGLIGQLGGVGARPDQIGAVSDADGAIVAIACALKLASMVNKGELLTGDVIITTHICPNSPTIPHDPVPFMGSPVELKPLMDSSVDPEMDAILSVDATKGNEIINLNGFAISSTVKEGYILRVSGDLLRMMKIVLSRPPVTFPISMQDITPYGNGLYHINSILQPATVTNSPVVGVAPTSGQVIPGVATGANYPLELESTARFCLEVAKEFGRGSCRFYDEEEFERIVDLYGPMNILQTLGR